MVTRIGEYFAAVSNSIEIARGLLQFWKGAKNKKILASMINQANEAKELAEKTVLQFGDVRKGFLQVCCSFFGSWCKYLNIKIHVRFLQKYLHTPWVVGV